MRPSWRPDLKFRVTRSRSHRLADIAAELVAERDHGGGVEAVALAETDRLGRGEQARAAQEIGDGAGRLRRLGGARGQHAGGQRVEHRAAARDRGVRAADHQRQLALLGLRRRAEGGGGDEVDAARRQLLGKRRGRHRIGGAEIEHDAALDEALGDALPAEADLAQLGGRRQHGDDDIGGLRHHLRRAQRHAAIVVGEQAGRDVGDVVDRQRVVAGPQQPQRHPRAEGADADHAEPELRHRGPPWLRA